MIRSGLIALAIIASSPGWAQSVIAIAFDETALVHAFGMSDTPESAQQAAMDVCSASAGACEVRWTHSGPCMALSVDYTSGGWGTAWGTTAQGAQRFAVQSCLSYENNFACAPVEAVCLAQQ